MKYTIEGFSQEYALTLTKKVPTSNGKEKLIRVDCNDLVILRWFVDFYPRMMKVEIDGKQYAWVKYQALLEDLPLLDIKKRMLFERLQKLVDFGVLSHKSIKSGGSFSYYGFGENYIKLIDNSARIGMQKNADGQAENCETVSEKMQTGTQETAEQINSSFKDTSNKDNSIKEGIYIRTATNDFLGTYKNIKLKENELEKLYKEYGEKETQEAIEHLSEYIELKGYKAKSHYLAMRKWVFTAVKEERIKQKELEQREKRAQEIAKKNTLHDLKSFYGSNHFANERDYTPEEYKALETDIDKIVF